MASIEKLAGGYRVTWRTGGRGSKLRHTGLLPTKGAALQAKDRIEAELATRSPMRRGVSLPLSELVERWHASRITAGNAKYSTDGTRDRMLYHIRSQDWHTVDDITPEAIERWRASSPRTVRAGALIRTLLAWAQDYAKQQVPREVLTALRPPRIKRTPPGRLLTPEQVQAYVTLAAAASEECGLLIECLSTYGWRPISAARLTAGDVDPKAGTIRCRVKGGDIVEHPLLERHAAAISRVLKGRKSDEPIFCDPRTGKAWGMGSEPNSISVWTRHYLGLAVYDLKRYAISTMLARGLPAQDVALFSGHRTLSQVLTYARTSIDRGREALKVFPVEHQGTRSDLPPTTRKRKA